MTNGLRVAVASLVVTVVAVASAGPATADNSNNNSNTNDVTNIGGSSNDMGASTSDENTNWPPTASDWPPQDVLDAGDSGTKGKDNSAAKPIVMPRGQTAPAQSDTPSTTETTKPIVPAGAP
jgi:hypothetical protein